MSSESFITTCFELKRKREKNEKKKNNEMNETNVDYKNKWFVVKISDLNMIEETDDVVKGTHTTCYKG